MCICMCLCYMIVFDFVHVPTEGGQGLQGDCGTCTQHTSRRDICNIE